MAYDKVLMYGGIFLFGLFVLNMVLVLSSLDSLKLEGTWAYAFPVLFVIAQSILVYQARQFIKESELQSIDNVREP